jgi:hypothetical protein
MTNYTLSSKKTIKDFSNAMKIKGFLAFTQILDLPSGPRSRELQSPLPDQ